MEDIAGWVAPIATTLAAMITAANLGARITGIGFIVFMIGSIAWATVGHLTHQPNLLYQNILLCAVNVIGIWRWLGRQARYDVGAEKATKRSERPDAVSLFPLSRVAGGEVRDESGAVIARAIDAMVSRDDGRIQYLVISEGGVAGVGETLHALDWSCVRGDGEGIVCAMSGEAVRALPELAPDAWPGRAPAHA